MERIGFLSSSLVDIVESTVEWTVTLSKISKKLQSTFFKYMQERRMGRVRVQIDEETSSYRHHFRHVTKHSGKLRATERLILITLPQPWFSFLFIALSSYSKVSSLPFLEMNSSILPQQLFLVLSVDTLVFNWLGAAAATKMKCFVSL